MNRIALKRAFRVPHTTSLRLRWLPPFYRYQQDEEYNVQDLAGKRIATTYLATKSYMDEQGVVQHMLTGSVEVAPQRRPSRRFHRRNLVSTGATLEANGLKLEAIFNLKQHWFNVLVSSTLTRLHWVLKNYWLVCRVFQQTRVEVHHASRSNISARANQSTTWCWRSTVFFLYQQTKAKFTFHLVSTENLFWETMEQLKELRLQESSILVLPIEKNDGVTAMRTVVWQSLSDHSKTQ